MLTKDDLDQIRDVVRDEVKVVRDEVKTVEEHLNGKINIIDRKVEAVHATKNRLTMRLWSISSRATRLVAKPKMYLRSELNGLKNTSACRH